jgi:hypothetical protein
MGKIVNELPSIKRFSTDCRQGLRKLSPELIGKARDNTAAQVTRIWADIPGYDRVLSFVLAQSGQRAPGRQ